MKNQYFPIYFFYFLITKLAINQIYIRICWLLGDEVKGTLYKVKESFKIKCVAMVT